MFIFAESQMKKEDRRDSATAELTLIAYCGAERSGEVTPHCWNAVFLYIQQEQHLFKAFGFWFAISILGIFKYMSSRGMMEENSSHYWLPLVSAEGNIMILFLIKNFFVSWALECILVLVRSSNTLAAYFLVPWKIADLSNDHRFIQHRLCTRHN